MVTLNCIENVLNIYKKQLHTYIMATLEFRSLTLFDTLLPNPLCFIQMLSLRLLFFIIHFLKLFMHFANVIWTGEVIWWPRRDSNLGVISLWRINWCKLNLMDCEYSLRACLGYFNFAVPRLSPLPIRIMRWRVALKPWVRNVFVFFFKLILS